MCFFTILSPDLKGGRAWLVVPRDGTATWRHKRDVSTPCRVALVASIAGVSRLQASSRFHVNIRLSKRCARETLSFRKSVEEDRLRLESDLRDPQTIRGDARDSDKSMSGVGGIEAMSMMPTSYRRGHVEGGVERMHRGLDSRGARSDKLRWFSMREDREPPASVLTAKASDAKQADPGVRVSRFDDKSSKVRPARTCFQRRVDRPSAAGALSSHKSMSELQVARANTSVPSMSRVGDCESSWDCDLLGRRSPALPPVVKCRR